MTWSLEENTLDPKELEIYKYALTQSKNSTFALNLLQFVRLYSYLETQNYANAQEVRNDILTYGKPLFSASESEKLFELISKRGGGQLLDNLIHQWVNFIYGWTPGFIADMADTVTPYIFILKTMEQNPYYGPFLGMALDGIHATLPTIGLAIENIAPTLVGFLPIPEAGPVGAIIGWMVGSVFMFLTMLTALSRQHFGQAFLLTFSLIPFVGASMYSAALAGEKFLTNIAEKRTRLIETSRRILGDTVAEVADMAIPDPLAPPPEYTGHTSQQPDPSNILSSLGLPTSVDELKQKGRALAESRGIPTSLDDLKQKGLALAESRGIPTSLDGLKQKGLALAESKGIPTSLDGLKQKELALAAPAAGGNRLSSQLRANNKWRTQKRSRL
jgi:hypothetical protein